MSNSPDRADATQPITRFKPILDVGVGTVEFYFNRQYLSL